ncbi:Uncharacterised protein [Serratia fonticola]|uniref:hypothetical protein n=1 Tax=Serratia fonticola TaxID=47917 RepID=UPI002177C514|nr:hypothetical protein [Serratia fonticola]CAI1818936.1 Uncharacterised protein [Serratia fonticola]
MSKYEELRMTMSSLVASEQAYWGKLYKAYHDVHQQFSDFLGLSTESVKDPEGKARPVIEVGIFDAQKQIIQPTPGSSLPKNGRNLSFHILLNLCTSEDEEIQATKVVLIKLSRNGDEYYFEVEGLPSKITCYEIDGRVDMNPFFDDYHSALIKQLSIR